MPRKSFYSSCEVPASSARKGRLRNRQFRFRGDYSWSGVKKTVYKRGGSGWRGVSRQEITGGSGESSRFHLRYFEIEPGGFSSYEVHSHEHVVICVRGSGEVRLDNKKLTMNYMDIQFVKGGTPHMLMNPGSEPFGFFCIVDAERDSPCPAGKIRSGNRRNGGDKEQ